MLGHLGVEGDFLLRVLGDGLDHEVAARDYPVAVLLAHVFVKLTEHALAAHVVPVDERVQIDVEGLVTTVEEDGS